MFSSWRRLSARVGRWPRRIAALACLAMAALTAVAPKPGSTAAAPVRPGLGLTTAEVAVPLALQVPALSDHLHRGDRVGVVYSPDPDTLTGTARGQPSLVADRLRVLSVDVRSDYGSDSAATVLLATDRTVAVRLARFATRDLRLVVDPSP